MARKKRSAKKQETEVQDYRHDDATRKNNPPAGIASHGRVHEQPGGGAILPTRCGLAEPPHLGR